MPTLPAPDALIFDMDGVLVDVRASYREAIVQTAAHFGAFVTPAQVDRRKEAGEASNDWEVTRDLLGEAGVDVPLDDVVRVFETLYEGSPGHPGLREREKLLVARETLERWAAARPLGIVTGRPRAQALAALERWELSHLFGAMVCMGETAPKPSAEPVLAAASALGVSRVWMLGDTPDDIVAAREAGAVPLGVTWGAAVPGRAAVALRRAGAVRIARQVEEVDKWLDELSGPERE